jgi:4-hydroxy-3-methylbut-2-enyl diphosphate reductase
VELCEHKLPTYFIQSEADILSDQTIRAFNWITHEEYTKEGFLTGKKEVKVLITSGASCPDAIVEAVIEKLSSFYPDAKSMDSIRESWN